MCRIVAYLGHNVLLEDVVVKPANSIVKQSLNARESSYPTNGDGFGLGWYAPQIDDKPSLFTSISPAWNDRNLLEMAAKIKSPAFFAHVRAASLGGVTQYNCHPFVCNRLMMMHNGEIANFFSIKRHLRHLLDDDIYNWIKGETDSEHLFALFLQLGKGRDLSQISVMADVLEETFNKTLALIQQYGCKDPSYFNVCITDGKQIIASRFCTDTAETPESMHYALGSRFVAKNSEYHMLLSHTEKPTCVLVASEKLTNFDLEWHDVTPNHLLLLDSEFKIQKRAL